MTRISGHGASRMLRGWINHLDLTVSGPAVSVPFYAKVLAHPGLERLEPTGTGPGRPAPALARRPGRGET